MMTFDLVVIGYDLTALVGIAGDVGDRNRPPARRGITSLRLGEQLNIKWRSTVEENSYPRIFFVFCLDSVDPFRTPILASVSFGSFGQAMVMEPSAKLMAVTAEAQGMDAQQVFFKLLFNPKEAGFFYLYKVAVSKGQFKGKQFDSGFWNPREGSLTFLMAGSHDPRCFRTF